MNNEPTKCHICGEPIDDDDGDCVSDNKGRLAHEACHDADEEAAQNAPDLDPPDFEFAN